MSDFGGLSVEARDFLLQQSKPGHVGAVRALCVCCNVSAFVRVARRALANADGVCGHVQAALKAVDAHEFAHSPTHSGVLRGFSARQGRAHRAVSAT
jgi:hypothetical protein